MIRFLADADLNDAIVGGCRRREPAIDFWSANDVGLEGVSDPEVLALAAAAERVLVSHDFQTMPRHFADYLQARGSSPGLILVPQHMPIGDVIEELLLIWGRQMPRSGAIGGRRCPCRVGCADGPAPFSAGAEPPGGDREGIETEYSQNRSIAVTPSRAW